MEIKTVDNPIDGAGRVKQVAANLFYGWGYNFYRDENKLRADDLLVRGKVSDLIGEARSHLAALEASYRREHLPAPTRERPFPDPEALARVRQFGDAMRSLESLETRVRNAAVPEMDRVMQRHRNERDTLQKLVVADGDLVEAVVRLRDGIMGVDDLAGLQQDQLRDLEQQVAAAWTKREAVVDPVVVGNVSG